MCNRAAGAVCKGFDVMLSTHTRQFARQNWMLLSVFLLATVVALWFLIGIALDFIYFNDPRHQDADLKPWMTPRYIVMSYDLPRPLVLEILGLPEIGGERRSLGRIAADQNMTLDELTELVRKSADAYREAQQ